MSSRVATRSSMFALLLIACTLAGCGSKESHYQGTYINQQDQSKLELKAEHKGTVVVGKETSDISWEMVSDEKIIVHFVFPIELLKTADGLVDPQGVNWKKQ